MFQNKTFQVKVVKDPVKPVSPHAPLPPKTPLATTVSELVQNTGKYAIGAYAAVRVIDLSCNIVQHIVVKKFP